MSNQNQSTVEWTKNVKDKQLSALLSILDQEYANEYKNGGKSNYQGKRMNKYKITKNEMHGKLGNKDWIAPKLVVECNEEARPGYRSMKAHEYAEDPKVLREKVKLLAKILLKSNNCIAYTGAGISTASGIDDYASKAKNSVAMKRKKVSGFDAQPTLAHRVLTALYFNDKKKILKHWVQQNHDGLPQKAGFPQEMLNEIHGAWYDPSNPVVPMSGSLRGDLCKWLEEWEERADFCMALGTSLCGMNADRMVETPAAKFANGKGFGAVIVSLQRTQYDDVSSLRIYAKIDEVAALLARELQLNVKAQTVYKPKIPKENIISDDYFRVPYDKFGNLTKDKSKFTTLDLRKGTEVRLTNGPGKGYIGVVTGKKKKDGHYRIALPFQREGHEQQGLQWTSYIFGSWFLETIMKGSDSLKRLPLVNTGNVPSKDYKLYAPSKYYLGKIKK